MSSSAEPAKGEGAAVPAHARGSWSSFLKSIASFSGDLSSMTAPPFILSTTSLTEFSSYWAEHPSLFVAPAAESDPAKRMLAVLKWFLSTLKQQYASRSEKLGSEKKPLNPFLGELFLGRWVDESGETQLVSEQVSHHPPVTAYCIWNSKHGVQLQGYNGQRAAFSRMTINVKQIGHALLRVEPHNDTYLITLPSLHIEGLYSGSPFIELNKATYITSTSGYTAKIDYSGRGWLSGKKNSFTGSVYSTGQEKDVLYTVEGQWTDSFTIKDAKGKSTVDSYSAKNNKTVPLTVAPLDNQDTLESRRAWQKVASAIKAGDMDTAGREKGIIENSQRDMRKKEQEEGREWERRFFSRVTHHEVFEALATKLPPGEGGQAIATEGDKTGGVWVWDEEKAKNAKPPFR